MILKVKMSQITRKSTYKENNPQEMKDKTTASRENSEISLQSDTCNTRGKMSQKDAFCKLKNTFKKTSFSRIPVRINSTKNKHLKRSETFNVKIPTKACVSGKADGHIKSKESKGEVTIIQLAEKIINNDNNSGVQRNSSSKHVSSGQNIKIFKLNEKSPKKTSLKRTHSDSKLEKLQSHIDYKLNKHPTDSLKHKTVILENLANEQDNKSVLVTDDTTRAARCTYTHMGADAEHSKDKSQIKNVTISCVKTNNNEKNCGLKPSTLHAPFRQAVNDSCFEENSTLEAGDIDFHTSKRNEYSSKITVPIKCPEVRNDFSQNITPAKQKRTTYLPQILNRSLNNKDEYENVMKHNQLKDAYYESNIKTSTRKDFKIRFPCGAKACHSSPKTQTVAYAVGANLDESVTRPATEEGISNKCNTVIYEQTSSSKTFTDEKTRQDSTRLVGSTNTPTKYTSTPNREEGLRNEGKTSHSAQMLNISLSPITNEENFLKNKFLECIKKAENPEMYEAAKTSNTAPSDQNALSNCSDKNNECVSKPDQAAIKSKACQITAPRQPMTKKEFIEREVNQKIEWYKRMFLSQILEKERKTSKTSGNKVNNFGNPARKKEKKRQNYALQTINHEIKFPEDFNILTEEDRPESPRHSSKNTDVQDVGKHDSLLCKRNSSDSTEFRFAEIATMSKGVDKMLLVNGKLDNDRLQTRNSDKSDDEFGTLKIPNKNVEYSENTGTDEAAFTSTDDEMYTAEPDPSANVKLLFIRKPDMHVKYKILKNVDDASFAGLRDVAQARAVFGVSNIRSCEIANIRGVPEDEVVEDQLFLGECYTGKLNEGCFLSDSFPIRQKSELIVQKDEPNNLFFKIMFSVLLMSAFVVILLIARNL